MTQISQGLITLSRISFQNVNRNKLVQRQQQYLQSLSRRTYTCHVNSSLSNAEPMDYTRGWAWQQIFLNRRLQYQRKVAAAAEDTNNIVDEDQVNVDRILLLEHKPVYTLGRGASEDHLTFLEGEADGGMKARMRLSRKARGDGSCRLAVDRIQSVPSGISPLEEVNAMRKYMGLLEQLSATIGNFYLSKRGIFL